MKRAASTRRKLLCGVMHGKCGREASTNVRHSREPRSNPACMQAGPKGSSAESQGLSQGGHREIRTTIATTVGGNVHLTGALLEVHNHDALPHPTVVLVDADLVASSDEPRELDVVDGADHVREEPYHDEQLVGERLGIAHSCNALALPMRIEVGNDPFDDRMVCVVAVQEPYVLERLVRVLELSREELSPTPVATLTENALNARTMRFEGLGYALIAFAKADAKAAVGVLSLGPHRSGRGEMIEDRLGQTPPLLVIRTAESDELLVNGLLIGVFLGRSDKTREQRDPLFHKVVVASKFSELFDRPTEPTETTEEFYHLCAEDFRCETGHHDLPFL